MENILPEIFPTVMEIIMLLSITAAPALVIFFLVFSLIRFRRRHPEQRLRRRIPDLVITFVCVTVASAAWVLNFGWLRFIATLFGIFSAHATFFAIVGIKSALAPVPSRRLTVFRAISHASFVLAYFLFPDSGDIGGNYFFFGLIHDAEGYGFIYCPEAVTYATGYSVLFYLASFVFLVLTLVNSRAPKAPPSLPEEPLSQLS